MFKYAFEAIAIISGNYLALLGTIKKSYRELILLLDEELVAN
jgi:hypothetical protein